MAINISKEQGDKALSALAEGVAWFKDNVGHDVALNTAATQTAPTASPAATAPVQPPSDYTSYLPYVAAAGFAWWLLR